MLKDSCAGVADIPASRACAAMALPGALGIHQAGGCSSGTGSAGWKGVNSLLSG
jgi:hypothetical protein